MFITGNVVKPGHVSADRRHDRAAADCAGRRARRSTPTARTSSSCARRTGSDQSFKFNYKDVVKQKNLQQNIVLKPGDTVVVP